VVGSCSQDPAHLDAESGLQPPPLPLCEAKELRFEPRKHGTLTSPCWKDETIQTLPEGSSDFRTQREQSSIIFEHCPKLFELCSMSSDRVTIDSVRKQSSGRMRNAGRPENPCPDCSGRCGETALAVHLRVVCAARDGNVGHAVVSRSFAPGSVSAWISTRSAVCPWLKWLVTAYPPCRIL